MAAVDGLKNKCIACVAQRELLVYSLEDFEIVGHEFLEHVAVSREVRGNVAYIGFSNGVVGVYDLASSSRQGEGKEEEETCQVIKTREI